MLTFGTSHFFSLQAAKQYYKNIEPNVTLADIKKKVAEGLISIGPPSLKPDERLGFNNEDGRYMKIVPELT